VTKQVQPRPGGGTPGPGRPKGRQNNYTVMLKNAILIAAEKLGEESDPELVEEIGGIAAYLVTAARKKPDAFMRLLGQTIPHDTGTQAGGYNLTLNFTPTYTPSKGSYHEDSSNVN